MAKVTYVDNEGHLILHDALLDTRLQLINELINDNFKTSQNNHKFEIGEPCHAQFENDGR